MLSSESFLKYGAQCLPCVRDTTGLESTSAEETDEQNTGTQGYAGKNVKCDKKKDSVSTAIMQKAARSLITFCSFFTFSAAIGTILHKAGMNKCSE